MKTTEQTAPNQKKFSSGTFREGSLMKQAGLFTFSLDKGAQNYFNNKEMIKNTITEIKEAKQ